jgi:two-component system response regulator FlrC
VWARRFSRATSTTSRRARAGGPFVAINCAAIPDNLLEATLFGYEKGAFTGAQAAQAGKFEQANGGTLLLDEISEMPLGLQAKLLRVLQEREVERVGGKKPVALDIRVLATSNRDMAGEVRTGRFREDLFYRLNVFPLEIRPCASVPATSCPWLGTASPGRLAAARRTARFAAAAEARLAAHPWPGNVRELENVVQRALIMSGSELIEAENLPLAGAVVAGGATPAAVAFSGPVPAPSVPAFAESPVIACAPANMKDLERQHILDTLAKVGGSRKKAVTLLGISERTLRYKLSQYRDEGFFSDDEEA